MSNRTSASPEVALDAWAASIAAWIGADAHARFAQFAEATPDADKLRDLLRNVEIDRVSSGSQAEPLGADAFETLTKKGNTQSIRDRLFFAVASHVRPQPPTPNPGHQHA